MGFDRAGWVDICLTIRFFLDLLTGILYVVAGWMMVSNPKESALLLTSIIA